jgi:superfamily II DNA or RNA helicase
LRSEGFLTNVEAKVLSIAYKSKVQKPIATHNEKGKKISTAKYKAELDFIYHNDYRNNILQQLCCNFNNNILVLINHLDHGETLMHTLQNCTNKQVFYVHGGVELQDREAVKQMMEKHNNIIVIAMSKIFSTGISINNIHMIVFASGGKSFVRVVQSIGRGLRLHDSKDKLTIIDVMDQLPYAIEHAQQRQSIYNSEKIKYSIVPFVEK